MLCTDHLGLQCISSSSSTRWTVWYDNEILYVSVFRTRFPANLYHSLTTLLSAPSVWLLIVLLVLASLIPDIVLRTLTDTFNPVFQYRRRKVTCSLTRRLLCCINWMFRDNQYIFTRDTQRINMEQLDSNWQIINSHRPHPKLTPFLKCVSRL